MCARYERLQPTKERPDAQAGCSSLPFQRTALGAGDCTAGIRLMEFCFLNLFASRKGWNVKKSMFYA